MPVRCSQLCTSVSTATMLAPVVTQRSRLGSAPSNRSARAIERTLRSAPDRLTARVRVCNKLQQEAAEDRRPNADASCTPTKSVGYANSGSVPSVGRRPVLRPPDDRRYPEGIGSVA